ncbi:cellulase family glycosylhydrolase [Streptomyces sp. B1866]|uniref:cellulase family glycosylhydrolase n=1 Tax=Streptomyces sp. B1866 TaxID=3075431 RepID=UPI002890119D|nr:cellulase family glycosylhydrolase [Streptomyces sp. B1866]MDT3400150.1 cellulase family glycosylhydrolase [Streptomyces sp. B1866]
MGFGDDDAAFLAANGYTVARVGVMWKAVEPTPGNYDDDYLDSIARTVKALASHGIYSLLDMHQDSYNEAFNGQGFPDWAVLDPTSQDATWDAFWNNTQVAGTGVRDRFARFWQHVAERFTGNPAVLGYDLMNEPHVGTQSNSNCTIGYCPQINKIRAAYNDATSAIRAVDATHPVFWERSLAALFTPPSIDAGATGNSYHVYCPVQPTDDPNVAAVRNTVVCPPAEAVQLALMTAQSHNADSAPLVTEFGSTPDTTELTRVAGELDQTMVGWTEWTYHRTGVTDFTLTPSVVDDPRLPPTGNNVNSSVLSALTRPYPLAVAGTPTNWSYNPEDRTFRLTYRPTRADGNGTFPAGSITELAAPALNYPHGYTAQVTGGTITSPPNAPRITIASTTGADTITVTLTGNR